MPRPLRALYRRPCTSRREMINAAPAWRNWPSLSPFGPLSRLNGAQVTKRKIKAHRADDMRRIADSLTNPKDAELVRKYANELATADSASR